LTGYAAPADAAPVDYPIDAGKFRKSRDTSDWAKGADR
jgi:hypothetical protein